MEKKGLRVDPAKLEALEFSILTELQMIMAKINELTGLNIEPHKPADCFELLCSHFGLPVLGWTEAGNPSFDAEALSKYAVHPQVVFNEKRSLIIKLLERFRDRHTLLNFFVKPYIERNVKGYLHPTFNQVVQTGRMSAKEPNAHQLSKDAKELVIPEEGKAFLAFDMEQIEFRLIAHFIKDPAAIEAYAKDPSTDYHQFVAGICQIPRSPAKTVNFCIGYGGGKKKVVTTLSQTKELVAHLADDAKKILDESLEHCMDIYRQRHRELPRDAVIDRAVLQQDIFESLCWKRGETVYNTYHDRFPGVKIEMRMANETALSRGWVKTIDGRKRILPRQAAWRAFNSVCQGSAADIQKYITVRSAPRYNSDVRAFGVDLVCQVHDENLFHGDKDATRDPKLIKLIAEIMETPRRPLRVPLRVAAGWSDKDWRTASGKEGKIQVPR
jgi:DNA polymerase-1